jgi:hypothetical protein
VRLEAGDVDAAAAHMGMAVADFTRAYTRLTSDRAALSLTEAGDGACVFLQTGAGCRIHGARPRQCREFPGRWRFTGAEAICAAARETPALENA